MGCLPPALCLRRQNAPDRTCLSAAPASALFSDRDIVALILTAAAGSLWLTSRPVSKSLARPELPAGADRASEGAAAFFGDGFGGISTDSLQTNAVPWRLVAAALVLDEAARDPSAGIDSRTLNRVLARFGFLPGAHAVNLPVGITSAAPELPPGMTYGDVAPFGGSKVRVANLRRAVCHAGVTSAPDGAPLPDAAMLGMPNTSVDLETYTLAIFSALRRFADDPKLLEVAAELFPDIWTGGNV